MVVGLCERFHCLPDPGGLLDQDVSLIRMCKIVALATPAPEGA